MTDRPIPKNSCHLEYKIVKSDPQIIYENIPCDTNMVFIVFGFITSLIIGSIGGYIVGRSRGKKIM